MDAVECKMNLISNLEDALARGERVVLYACDDELLLEMLIKHIHDRVNSNIELLHCLKTDMNISFAKEIPVEWMNELLNLYRLYDFSDNVIVIEESNQYGTLFNYVKCGLLSIEELVEAFMR